MKNRIILILIGGHLSTAPRVQKEAAALQKAGAHVIIRGTWRNLTLAKEDELLARKINIDFSAVVDLSVKGSLLFRIKQKISSFLFSRFGIVTPRVYGLAGPELLDEARRVKPELTIVHSEAGLWVSKKLLNEGFRVGVDFEDWFSQDLPENDRKNRPVRKIQSLERYLLANANCTFTTTNVMANALAKDAGVVRIPTVIPNCFPANTNSGELIESADQKPAGAVSFYWVSQTIGPGRGLENLARSLTYLRGEWQLVLRGDLRGYRDWFNENFPEQLRARVKLMNIVPNDELLACAMSHDVGLALEIPYCANKELTASNKIFEYLRAGLAVIATSTLGQQEVMAACPNAGQLVKPGDTMSLATAMQLMIDNREFLESSKKASARAGHENWAWQKYEDLLVNAVAEAFT